MTDKTYNIDKTHLNTNIWANIKKNNNITKISLIIYSNDLNQKLILVGKESNSGYPNKTDINLISNFRGRIINDESIPQAAGRILFEKTMNMIIEPYEFENLIIENKVKYIINNNIIVFVFQIDYAKYHNVPEYYGKMFRYLSICTSPNSMNNWIIDSCPLGFFDKSDLYWTNIKQINDSTIYKKIFLNELFEIIDILDKEKTDKQTNSYTSKDKQTNLYTSKDKQTNSYTSKDKQTNSYKPFWFSV
jgi:hypothetical protein